jgi:hypothetical protein
VGVIVLAESFIAEGSSVERRSSSGSSVERRSSSGSSVERRSSSGGSVERRSSSGSSVERRSSGGSVEREEIELLVGSVVGTSVGAYYYVSGPPVHFARTRT